MIIQADKLSQISHKFLKGQIKLLKLVNQTLSDAGLPPIFNAQSSWTHKAGLH